MLHEGDEDEDTHKGSEDEDTHKGGEDENIQKGGSLMKGKRVSGEECHNGEKRNVVEAGNNDSSQSGISPRRQPAERGRERVAKEENHS